MAATMAATILVVDDEPDLELIIRQKFRKRIRQKEIQLIFAGNGVEALAILQDQRDIDMVLTDINMPKMDGLTLLTNISKKYPTIKTVIVSAYSDLPNIRSAMNRGAFDFLTKPIDLQDLEITTNKTLAQVQQIKSALKKEQLAQEAKAESLQKLQAEIAIRREAQEALRESERRVTKFLETLPVGIFVIDGTGKPYYTNQTAQELLGKEIVPNTTAEELPEIYQAYIAGTEELYPSHRQPIVRALNGESITIDDIEIRRSDKIIPLEMWGTPIFNEKGEIVYAMEAFQDITHRKQAEKLIAEYNRTLEEQVQERTVQLAEANQEIMTLNKKLKAENIRLSAELDILREMQQLILPKLDELEAIQELDIAGFMEPADEVGGDYYDVLYTDGVVTIGIGDVTGHGLESGILMVMTQTAVRTLKEIQETDHVRFLDTLNRTIYKNVQRMNSDKNLTLAILNYAEGRISISGQHEETLVVRKNGQLERISTMDLGLPIGLDDEIADFISQTTVELEPGDGVVLYTDGIPEARDINKKFYGMERLCEVVSEHWQLSAREIKRAAIANLREFIGEQKVFDDITLVVLKRKDEEMVM